MKKGGLSHLVRPGVELAIKVTPKASRNAVVEAAGQLRVYVTAAPENGKANMAVRVLLAEALGVPKSAVVLLRGKTDRDKVFRLG